MKHVNSGDSIECSQSMIAVRKVTDPMPKKFENVEGRFFKYKSNIRAIVKVIGELEPLEAIISDTSNLKLDDELEGEVLEIYTKKIIKFKLTSNFSHVHTIAGNTVNCFTYAKIVIPWRFILERETPLLKAQKIIEN